MFTGPEIVTEISRLGISHVIWVPDSETGKWERDLEASPNVQLVRVCREGEAWPLAAGLMIGGRAPLVIMQTTGFYESGDALRNVAYDLCLPVFALVGARSWLDSSSTDSARKFAEPVMKAWGIDYRIIESAADKHRFSLHYQCCQAARKPGAVLLAE